MAKTLSEARTTKVALIGSETLLGRELTEVLRSRFPGLAITDYAASAEGTFGEAEGEAVYVEPFEESAVRDSSAILIAGSPKGALKAYELVKAAKKRPYVIDCTGHLESQPEARIIAPLTGDVKAQNTWLLVVAHPAASALALTLKRLTRYRKLRQVIAHVFEPASERDKRGAAELHQQTTSLLSFKPLEKKIFDAQISFNLLPQYGEEAETKLVSIEQRIERHIATILGSERSIGPIPIPSLRVVAAPVFHGYSISIWAEFESNINAEELGEALASAQVEVRSPNEEPPTGVGVAGQSGLIAGDIRVDSNNGHAAWFWVVGDNLRLTADAVGDLVGDLGVRAQ
ncbi:MAG: hypothetical protein M3Y24_12280 [Acidobacteriota bacterium]|nr:hypothetical protein [Acidobacteriota bacterium]